MYKRQLYLTGTTTPNCIRTTCYDGLSLDYNVGILTDCCSSNSEEIQQANMVDMANIGATLMTCAAFCDGQQATDWTDLVQACLLYTSICGLGILRLDGFGLRFLRPLWGLCLRLRCDLCQLRHCAQHRSLCLFRQGGALPYPNTIPSVGIIAGRHAGETTGLLEGDDVPRLVPYAVLEGRLALRTPRAIEMCIRARFRLSPM